MHAYVESRLGKRRWFLHKRGGTPIVETQQDMSFLQKRFLELAYDEYGQTKSNLPPEARKHL